MRKGRGYGQKNGVGGDEDEKKKTDAVKSKAVKRKTELIKTSYANNEDDQDENQNDRAFSQDSRPDTPKAGPPPAKAPRRSSRGLQGVG